MWRVIDFIVNVKNKIIFAIKNFKKNPIDSLGVLLPVLIVLVGFVFFMISYISFLMDGGYTKQIEIINAGGEEVLSRAENISIPYLRNFYDNQSLVSDLIVLLLLGQFVVMMIAFFKRESRFLKVVMKIDLIVLGVGIIAVFIVTAMGDATLLLSKEQQDKIIEFANGNLPQVYETVVKNLFFIIMVATVICLILCLISKSRWMLGYSLLAIANVWIVFPILLELLVGAVYIGVLLLTIAIVGLIIWVLFAEMAAKSGPMQINVSLEYGCQLCKVKGWTGDSIEFFDGEEYSWVCSLEDLKRGNVCIYDTVSRRNIGMLEIPWR